MPDPSPTHAAPTRRRPALPALLAAAAAAALAACSHESLPNARPLTTADFTSGTPVPPPAPDPVQTPPTTPEPVTLSAIAAREGVVDVSALPGPPELPSEPAVAVEAPVLVDAVVGDINGKPIRAETILEPMAERLIAKGREQGVTREAWMALANELIRDELIGELREELLKAEALASLKPEQRRGLEFFLNEWREDLRRRSGGSRAAAAERLQEEQGISEHEWIRQQEARILIQHQLERSIDKLVQVSWQDVQLYYERNADKYNPPPTAAFRLISVPASAKEEIEQIQSALDRGEPFAEVASLPANYNAPETGGLRTIPLPPEGLANASLFGPEPLNAAARAMQPGDWTREPIPYGSSLGWIFFEGITSTSRSLEDREVQLEIIETLTQQRRREEMERFFVKLMERASFTDVELMHRRLLEIAAARYMPPSLK